MIIIIIITTIIYTIFMALWMTGWSGIKFLESSLACEKISKRKRLS